MLRVLTVAISVLLFSVNAQPTGSAAVPYCVWAYSAIEGQPLIASLTPNWNFSACSSLMSCRQLSSVGYFQFTSLRDPGFVFIPPSRHR